MAARRRDERIWRQYLFTLAIAIIEELSETLLVALMTGDARVYGCNLEIEEWGGRMLSPGAVFQREVLGGVTERLRDEKMAVWQPGVIVISTTPGLYGEVKGVDVGRFLSQGLCFCSWENGGKLIER